MTAAAILALALTLPLGGFNLSDPTHLFDAQGQNLSKKIGKALRVKCDLCADGNITIEKGVRMTLYKDARVEIHGFSMGETLPPRGGFLRHRYMPGTAANLFALTHLASDHEELAFRWYRIMAGATLRVASGFFAPRLTVATVIFEAVPHQLFRGREGELAKLFQVSPVYLTNNGFVRKEIFLVAPGVDFSLIGPVTLHLEAMYAYLLSGGTIMATTISLSIPL